jgi:Zn-dependent peptidase ImmA (M78 family)/DNA-binding XRE family transcriptional regulator
VELRVPPTDTTTWVGRQIRAARERLGLSQEDLARRLNRTQTAVSYWESGKRAPGLDDLVDLADVLQQDVSFFLPQSARPPIRAVLRAATTQLADKQLWKALQALVDEAESMPAPPRELEIAATRPTRAAQELLVQADVEGPPVDVEAIARRCGARVVRRTFEDALSGLVIDLDDGALIGVNVQQHEYRQRFTIAHELGHYLLGHHDRFHIDLGANAEDGHPPGYDWQSERSANDFAAELLMPAGFVHEAFATDESPARLARKFKVSELAMGYRLVNLGLR